MSNTEPTNAVLDTKLDALKELMSVKFQENADAHAQVNEHLRILNGQVSKNTAFRLKAGVYVVIGGFVISATVTFIGNILIKQFIN